MKLSAFLADSAQLDPRGKLHALGLLAKEFPTPTTPMSLILIIEVEPEDQIGSDSFLTGGLYARETSRLVSLGEGNEAEEIEFKAELPASEATRPEKSSGRAVATLNFGAGMPIPVGDYYWEVRIDGQGESARIPIRIVDPDEAPDPE